MLRNTAWTLFFIQKLSRELAFGVIKRHYFRLGVECEAHVSESEANYCSRCRDPWSHAPTLRIPRLVRPLISCTQDTTPQSATMTTATVAAVTASTAILRRAAMAATPALTLPRYAMRRVKVSSRASVVSGMIAPDAPRWNDANPRRRVSMTI